jgi:hypothetical protein
LRDWVGRIWSLDHATGELAFVVLAALINEVFVRNYRRPREGKRREAGGKTSGNAAWLYPLMKLFSLSDSDELLILPRLYLGSNADLIANRFNGFRNLVE